MCLPFPLTNLFGSHWRLTRALFIKPIFQRKNRGSKVTERFLRLLIGWPAFRLTPALAETPAIRSAPPLGTGKCPSFPRAAEDCRALLRAGSDRRTASATYSWNPVFRALIAAASGQRHPWRLQKLRQRPRLPSLPLSYARADDEMPPGGLTTALNRGGGTLGWALFLGGRGLLGKGTVPGLPCHKRGHLGASNPEPETGRLVSLWTATFLSQTSFCT